MSRTAQLKRERLESRARRYAESGGQYMLTEPQFLTAHEQERWDASKAAWEELQVLDMQQEAKAS